MNDSMLFNGNEKRQFLAELTAGRLSHAYLIEGGEGFGKTFFGLFAAKAVLCTGDDRPCGRCPSCRRVAAGNHPDLMYVAPDKKVSIGVDEVREIRSTVFLMPGEGDRKVYIIDDAHKMTVQAQNALLKFFEEPPDSAVFFIIADKKESLLPTVVSRARIITLYPSPEEDIYRFLLEKHRRADESTLRAAASMAGGSVGKAQEFLAKDVSRHRELCLAFLPVMFGGSAGETLAYLRSMRLTRDGTKSFLNLLLAAVNDVSRVKSGAGMTRLVPEADAKEYARRATDRRLAAAGDAVLDAYARTDANGNLNIIMTLLSDGLR